MTSAFYDRLARDLLQHYPRGPVAIAVTGPHAAITRRVADALAEAVDGMGRGASRAGARGDDPEAARAAIASFGSDGGDVLVVDGPQLLRPAIRGSWNASIWLEGDPALDGEALDGYAFDREALEAERAYVRDGDPRGAASAIIDVTDPERPSRVFSDSC